MNPRKQTHPARIPSAEPLLLAPHQEHQHRLPRPALPHRHHEPPLPLLTQQSQGTALSSCLYLHGHGYRVGGGDTLRPAPGTLFPPLEEVEKPKGSQGHIERGTETKGQLRWEGERLRSRIINE